MTMKKLILIASLALFTSCSHNGLLVAKGKVFLLNAQGLTYVNGTVVSDMSRENTKLNADIEDYDTLAQAENEQSLTGSVKVNYEIGKQITGYLVDLSKKAPEAVEEYLKDSEPQDK